MMGRVWTFGDDVNTDEIIPGRYNITTDPDKLAEHVFCEVRPEFAGQVQEGDVIVAGENFGCGSSREHAPIAIKASGIKCIIAHSFARIFYRNAINIGLPILECAVDVRDGSKIEVDVTSGVIKTDKKQYRAQPLPDFVLQIVDNGGIVSFLQEHDVEDLQ